jgi:chemotaxis protein CheX
MIIKEADVCKITESVWSTTFGFAIEALPEVPPDREEPVLTAFVLLAGGWDGALMIQCPATLARRCASQMFDSPMDAVTESDVNDALGELANMIGGNLKSLIPGSCTLSLPAVVDGRDHGVRVPGSHPLMRLAFASEGGEVVVCILERNATSPAAAS